MLEFGNPYSELECHFREFEDARLRRQRAIARQEQPIRRSGTHWSVYFTLALKLLGLFQILRMALDGGVHR